jgi:hypothetical protein
LKNPQLLRRPALTWRTQNGQRVDEGRDFRKRVRDTWGF